METSLARFRELARRVAGVFRRGRSDADLQDELRAHLEMASSAAGRDADTGEIPSRMAVLRHGALTSALEAQRDQRSLPWLDDTARDLRHVLRQLRRDPGFALAAILSLALGIGATTAAFSAIDALLLERLPIRNPDTLVSFMWNRPARAGGSQSARDAAGSADDIDSATGQPLFAAFSTTSFDLFVSQTSGIAEVFAAAPLWRLNVNVDRQAELRDGLLVSGRYYAILGVEPLRGRLLHASDDEPGAPPVAVISERYWRTRFGGDPNTLGRTLVVNRTVVTVVGIAPAAFDGVLLSFGVQDLTLPLALAREVGTANYSRMNPYSPWLRVMARVRSGVTLGQLRERLREPFQVNARQDELVREGEMAELHVVPAAYGRSASERKQIAGVLLPMLGLAALLLAVAALNVANLFLARASARAREMAMRVALGATRWRLVRLLLTEAVVLAMAGALVGMLLSQWGLDLLVTTFDPADRLMFANVKLNGAVLSFTLAAALLTGVVFALAPAWRARRLNPRAAFLPSSRWRGDHARLRRVLIVGQVALSSILLTIAALLVQTLRNVQAVDVGFATERLLLFRVDATPLGYEPAQFLPLQSRLASEIAAIPGVRSVTFSSWPLASGWSGESEFQVPDSPAPNDTPGAVIRVGPNYFETYGIPILAGRNFSRIDETSGAVVAIVNETLTRTYFGGGTSLGRRIRIGKALVTVIGIARDVRQTDARSPVLATVFVPFAQSAEGAAHFAVRTAADPAILAAPIRRAAEKVDENLPLEHVRTQTEELAWRLAAERFYVKGSVFLGLTALALVAVGLFGLMSYLVNRRTGEIGVRMALGAERLQVLWSVLREALVLVVLGVAIGIGGAIPTSRLVAGVLYGLSSTDPATYGLMAILLAGVATAACLLPARRAARVDPVVALRQE